MSAAHEKNAAPCVSCGASIIILDAELFNMGDHQKHVCRQMNVSCSDVNNVTPSNAVMYANSAMNAIIAGEIQAGGQQGGMHALNFNVVAEFAWQAAAAMVRREKVYRARMAEEPEGGDL